LWDGKKLNRILSQKGHEKEIHTASLHPDQSLLLTGDLAGFGMVWDLRTGKGIYEVQQTDSLLCSDFSPNGFEFAVAGKNNLISIFDLRRKK
jgi:U4/U6 small nuclear ribonucleoprotein PRP4